jgi:hypothetical protein
MTEKESGITQSTKAIVNFINSQIKFNEIMIGVIGYELGKLDKELETIDGNIESRQEKISMINETKKTFFAARSQFEIARSKWVNSMDIFLGMTGIDPREVIQIHNMVIPETNSIQ